MASETQSNLLALMHPAVCPGCKHVIPTADLNVATDIALCRRCGATHSLSGLLQREDLSHTLVSGVRPTGVWERTTAHGVSFGATHHSIGAACGALAIALFWNGIVSVFVLLNVSSTLHLVGVAVPEWFPAPIMNDEAMGWGMTLFLWVFLTPFLLIGAGLLGAFLMALAGRTEVRIDPDRGRIFTGIGPLGWTRRFVTNDVRGVRLRDKHWTDSDGDHQSKQEIVLERVDGDHLRFGSSLRPARRSYLAALLQRTLG